MGSGINYIMECKRGSFDLGELVMTIRANEPQLKNNTPYKVFRELVELHGGAKFWQGYLHGLSFVNEHHEHINGMVRKIRAADGCC